jgi:hypothetical protein
MQYKMLENNILSMSSQKEQERFEKQLNKMKREFCQNTYCDAPNNDKTERWFSKRYCSAFVRPTDQQQQPDAQYVSTGYHIPLCRFRDLWDTSTSKKLSVQNFQGISIRSERAMVRNRAILWLLYDIGIRVSELTNLRLDDLDRKI